MADFPETIPIFPLPNFVLFPKVNVPLHIFEARYREMVADVAQSHGIIGMVMLKGDWERDYYANPDVYEIGCAGKIAGMVRLPDGRFNLVLHGLREFRVARELRRRSYREAMVEWCPETLVALDTDATSSLRDLLDGFLGEAPGQLWRTLVDEQGLTGVELINFLCFHLDVTPLEKQTLLEALDTRAGCLLDVLTFKLEERKLGPGGPGGSSIVQ
ncbi:MAG: LON peptidase substrate-binding domain-containing protein [Candidatus Binataceae bacterium]